MRALMIAATFALAMGGASLATAAEAQGIEHPKDVSAAQSTEQTHHGPVTYGAPGPTKLVHTVAARDNDRHRRHRQCKTVWRNHHKVKKCWYS